MGNGCIFSLSTLEGGPLPTGGVSGRGRATSYEKNSENFAYEMLKFGAYSLVFTGGVRV